MRLASVSPVAAAARKTSAPVGREPRPSVHGRSVGGTCLQPKQRTHPSCGSRLKKPSPLLRAHGVRASCSTFTMRGRRPSSTVYGQEPKPYGYVECLCGRRTSSRARRSATSVVVGRPCAHCIGRRHCARWCTRCTHSARNNRSPNIRALRHACSSPPTPSEIQRESDEPQGRRVRRRLPTLDLRSRSSAGGGARTQRVSRMCCKCSQKCDASRRCVHGRGNPSEVTTTSHPQILQPSACRWAARTVPSNCGVAVSTRVASIPSPLR